MASPNPPNLPSLNSLPNGKDHLSHHHHHHHHLDKESLTFLQDSPLAKRRTGRRPFCFPPYHRLNRSLSSSVPLIILTYVMYTFLSRSQVQASAVAEPVNEPLYSSTGPSSTLTVATYRNSVIGEEGGGEGGGGNPKTTEVKSGPVTGGAEMVAVAELPSLGKELAQKDEMRKDPGGDGSLPVLLEPNSDSPPTGNKDGGDSMKKDKEISLYDLIEDADEIENALHDGMTTMELLFGDALTEFLNETEDLASSSSSMFSPSSSESSTQQVALPADFNVSSVSSDVSSPSPNGQPPQLSPQNNNGSDPLRNFPFSPPELQQETLDGVRILSSFPLPIAAFAPPSPLNYMMVQPSDVLPEVIGNRQKLTEDAKITAPKPEVEPLKIVARVANRRKTKAKPKSRKTESLSTESSSTSSSDVAVVVQQIVERVTKTISVKSLGAELARFSPQTVLSPADVQIEGEVVPAPSTSRSISRQKPSPVSETLPLNSIESYMEPYRIENTNGMLENQNLKLPPFHEIKKRRLPRSVFKEHKDKAGSTTFIVEGDEASVASSLDGIDIGSLDSLPVKRTKRRRAEKEEGQSQAVSNTNLKGEHQQNLKADEQDGTDSTVASQLALQETLLQKYLENGIAARHQMPAAETPISRQTSTSIGDQAASEESSSVAQQTHAPNMQLQIYQANQIHSQVQDNPRIFKVPDPIIIGRQKVRAGRGNSPRLLKRQAPMLRVQQQLQQMSSQGVQQWRPPPPIGQQQMTYSNSIQISQYRPPNANVNVLNQDAPTVQTQQNPGAPWQSQLAHPYSARSNVQTSNNLPSLPSYNQYQSQVLQQRPMYYHDALHSQMQRQSLGQSLQQYQSPMTRRPPASPSPALPFPQSGIQQQISSNGPYSPQLPLQQESSPQNSPPHSSPGIPLSPASPLPILSSPENVPRQQRGEIYGQYSPQSQSLVQRPFPSSSPIHYLPQTQLQQQSMVQRAPQYSSPGLAMQSPPSPGPGLPSAISGLRQQLPYGQYGVSNNQMKNTQAAMGTRPSANQYQQGQPYWNQDKMSMGFDSGNFLTPQTRYNIALQLQRLRAQQQARQQQRARQQVQSQEAQWNSQVSGGNYPSQQYSPTGVPLPGISAPDNYYGQQQQYYAPALNQPVGQISNPSGVLSNQQRLSQTGMSSLPYASPPYNSVHGQIGPLQGQMQAQNAFGMSGSIPDRRTPMPFLQYPYSPEVISGGEVALYRSKMGRPQPQLPQQYPTANRAGNNSGTGRESNGGERTITVPIFQSNGYPRQSTANGSNVLTKEGIPPENNYGSDAPSVQNLQLQSNPALDLVPKTARPFTNLTVSGPGTNSHPQGRHFHHSGGHTPFYSQSEVDAHHSRVTGHHQTNQDSEFENDAKILNWYLKQANQEVQALHHRPASVAPQAPSVQPGNLDGQGQTARPASAAGNYVTENPHTDPDPGANNATKTSD